jgi:hypothetical protein
MLAEAGITNNTTYADLALSSLIFSRVSQAMHVVYHQLNEDAHKGFLQQLKVTDDTGKSVTLKQELENIVHSLSYKVESTGQAFIEAAQRYGWMNGMQKWGKIGVDGNNNHAHIIKVDDNRVRQKIDSEEYRKAVGRICSQLYSTLQELDTRASIYFLNEDIIRTVGDESLDKTVNVTKLFDKLEEVNPQRMVSRLRESIDAYNNYIGGSAHATHDSKDVFVYMKTAESLLQYVNDLLNFHIEYFRREKIPGGKDIILSTLYQDGAKDPVNGPFIKSIRLAAYASGQIVSLAYTKSTGLAREIMRQNS